MDDRLGGNNTAISVSMEKLIVAIFSNYSTPTTSFIGTWRQKMSSMPCPDGSRLVTSASAPVPLLIRLSIHSAALLRMLPLSCSKTSVTLAHMLTSGLWASCCILWWLASCHFVQTLWPSWKGAFLKGAIQFLHMCLTAVNSWFAASSSMYHKTDLHLMKLSVVIGWRVKNFQDL